MNVRAFGWAILLVTFTCVPAIAADNAVREISSAAQAWLATLDSAQHQRATAPLESEQRFQWTPVPVQDRAGLPLKAMTPPQRAAATALLRSVLSDAGRLSVEAIFELELVLRDLGGGRKFPNGEFIRDPELYNYLVYGDPASKAWAWRVEGHHVSIHITVAGAQVAVTPMFLGSNPAVVQSGPKQGKATLRERQELGFALLNALRPDQRREAIIGSEVFDILERDPKKAAPLAPKGLCVCLMDAAQQAAVRRLLIEYLGAMRSDLARRRMDAVLRDGFDAMYFGWAGAAAPGKPHYYRLQGPSFLIEYDNSQNEANHIHSIWREFQGDFGRDLLQEHYRRSHVRR